MRPSPSSLRLALLVLALGASACSESATGSTVSALQPAGENHKIHLQGGVFAPGMHCASCHAPSGFAVDFSQNPEVLASGARFDPVTKTCSNVSCHGNFSIGTVSGTRASVAWVDTTPMSCASCHAMPPEGHPGLAASAGATTCAGCHAGTVKPDGTIDVAAGLHMNGQADMTGGTCSSCHGDPARVGSMPGVDVLVTSAPPSLPAGSPAWAEGAHLIHLNPNPAVAAARPTQCSECHVVPTDSTHATTPPAQKVVFGAMARANGANPTFVAGTQGCAATYCHGNFDFNGVTGQTSTMTWTDTARVGCTSCHAMPPAGHPPVAGGAPASCSACHPQTIDAGGAVVEAGTHINGRADIVALGCTGCHGDATRKGNLAGTDANLVSSPPVASTGAAPGVVGAHLGHVNPEAATAVMPPVACAECHVVPGDSAHATNPPASPVAFGTLARSNGATPTYVPGSLGCAATYCHGNFTFGTVTGSNATPIWTDAAPMACTSCHGMPPTGHPTYTGTPSAASCFQCHPQSVNADGTIKVAGGHLNGKADGGGCTGCHGDPPTTGRHTISDHRNLRCDRCHPTGFTNAATVAPFHDNGTTDIGSQAGYSCGLTGCPTGTRGNCTNTCHGRESW
jgi:predicted CxxxxCH...CXXCH cytochrome family protein